MAINTSLYDHYIHNALGLGNAPYTTRRITYYNDLPIFLDTEPDANGQCVLYIQAFARNIAAGGYDAVEKQIFLSRPEVEAMVAAGQEYLRRLDTQEAENNT